MLIDIHSRLLDGIRQLAAESLRFSTRARGFVGFAVGIMVCASAHGLIVGTTPNLVPGTAVNPATYGIGWTQGDPGWESTTNTGANYVYLGDGWVLGARHVGVWGSNFTSGTFAPIPGQNYVVKNPPPSLVNGLNLTTESDLRLIRINGDPGIPPVTVASQAPSLNSEVLMVSNGRGRQVDETHWNVTVGANNDPDGSPSWTWTETTGVGSYQGYKGADKAKRWGTNNLANVAGLQAFDAILSSTTGVIRITSRDILSMASVYDEASLSPLESQAIGGDSGGAVFHNFGTAQNPKWELAGILHATLGYEDQSSGWAVYGNGTVISDLSRYFFAYGPNGELHPNDYAGSISEVMWSQKDYSLVGDLNLDGLLSGDGSGSPDDDDVASFIAGWGYDNRSGLGTITSWKNGDLNHDGKTDVADFLMFRGALNGQISSSVMATLFGAASFDLGSVPEPSTALLASLALFGAFAVRRRPARPLMVQESCWCRL